MAFSDAESGNEPTSALAYPGPDGKLVYTTYCNVGDTRPLNTLPDWSNCGYMGGGVKIPYIPVKKIVEPVARDDRASIQAAIDDVSRLPFDSNGFRGAVLLKKGTYEVEGTIFIKASGVVLRGEGQMPDDGTRIIDTGQQQDTLISVEGGGRTEWTNTRTRIIDSFVPVGSQTFTVESTAQFSVGDNIIVHRQTNQQWIDDLNMGQYGWTPSYYEDKWERVITSIDGNKITIDVPIVQAIEEQYGGGSIFKCSSGGRISNVGLECLWLQSEYDFEDDETHGWNAVQLRNVENAWVRQVTSRYFGYACINVKGGTKNVTIQDCACLDPKSQTTGSRKYSFPIDDCCFVLIQRCFTRGGRHDYITHSRVPGPNAFVDCLAIQCYSDSGNHHRYAEGTLFDNIKAKELAVENRGPSGTGHGWSGAQTLFWNCEARTKCHAPLGAMSWAIGVIGEMRLGSWFPHEPLGWWESQGTHVTPRSLYYKQLEDRLGPEAVENVTIPAQRTGTIWNELNNWAGVGRMSILEPIYQTNFSQGLPDGWSIIDGYSDEQTWTFENPGNRSNSNWSGVFMIVDSDQAGETDMDEELISPNIDCSAYMNVMIKFKHYFNQYEDEICDVDVRAGGGNWINVERYQGADASGQAELDVSSIAVGQIDVQIRWHYYNANYENFWGIDDVEIYGTY